MNIRHHRPDIPRRVRFAVFGELDRFEVGYDGWVEVHGIPLVEGVDLAAFGYGDVGVGEDELAERLGGR